MNPSRRTLFLLLLCSIGPVFVAMTGWPGGFAFVPTAIVFSLLVADRMFGCALSLTVTRGIPGTLSVGTRNPVAISVRNHSPRPVHLEIADDRPSDGQVEGDETCHMTVPAFQAASVTYSYVPLRRGVSVFSDVTVRHRSRLGLWLVKQVFAVRDEVRVYPNIEAIRRYELMARTNSLAESGFVTSRYRGDGHEFERMRDYRPGDDPRRVDWKTTARVGRLIVREMGQERNQNLVFLIDRGRLMRQTTDGLSHFDYALNTAMILSHIARRRGDNIGAVIFSDRVHRYLPLQRGSGAVDALIHAMFDVEPEPVATDFSAAFRHVGASIHRRSLLLLMTHMGGASEQRQLREWTRHMTGRHLPVCLFFKEPALEEELSRPVTDPPDAFAKAAAAELWMERQERLSRLNRDGVMALDALPGEYSALAIARYLDVKARNLL